MAFDSVISPSALAWAAAWARRVCLALCALWGCVPAEAARDDGRVRVVATTSIVADLAREIGGADAHVISLMGPGVDPHLYKAREGDVRRLANADLILYTGLHLEAKMGEVLERLGERSRVVAVTSGIDTVGLLSPPEFEGAYDPHLWFDVSLWRRAAETTRDALMAADPARAQVYRANAERYLERLDTLHAYVRRQAERVPASRRVVVTAHDAFNYFGRAYGFQVRGLQGISTASEAGTADVQALADFIVARRIPAIFVESSIPQRTIEAVQAAVRARGFEVRIGGELYSDALGSPDGPAGSYEGMVRHNIDTVVGALLGQETRHP